MTSLTSERSRHALCRWLCPRSGEGAPPPDSMRLPAALPGQNALEEYGLAIFTTVFHALLGIDLLRRDLPWAAAVPLGILAGLLVLHLTCFAWISLTAGAMKLHPLSPERRCRAHDALQAAWMCSLAVTAIALGLTLSLGLGWMWLALVTANLVARAALAGWLGPLVFLALHILAVWIWVAAGRAMGLASLLGVHSLLLWALLKPNSQWLCPVIAALPSDKRQLWITIDDGPRPEIGAAMLDRLAARGVKATFFLVGQEAGRHPGCVRRIAAEGHGVGNHTFTHPRAWFWALPPWRTAREIADADAALRRLSGQSVRLFRGPVGFKNLALGPILKRRGLTYVGWTARAFDAVATDVDRAWRRLERGLRPGAIVLLHQTPTGLALLERLLAWAEAEGYECAVPSLDRG